MFSKVKVSDIANSSLNLAETKFYEVALALPSLLWVLQTLNLPTPRVIASFILVLKFALEPRLLTEILLLGATLNNPQTVYLTCVRW